ncbi:FAD-dependent oxidoreductase [uncultured Roseobacter sp.]|uniref:flavin monoamine oxidase family protein n=1 Tax=uncultured Roseobacter sp. TaxID=114847 RepID=UPI00262C5BFD|nr:FAD-dependent oxidoreductase [uncultured Roseobacter sp.]
MDTDILIIGAGLAGLSLARRLEQQGMDYLLCESAGRIGGRVKTDLAGQVPVDLGPAWIWPDQPRINALARQLGLLVFDQYSKGDGLWQTVSGEVHRAPGAGSMKGSFRIAGGLARLTQGLADSLPENRLLLQNSVKSLVKGDNGILAGTQRGEIRANRVVVAAPPRLVTATTGFSPSLPDEVMSEMHDVPTWMAGHAKFIAVYGRPWWREAGLSGDAISQTGPLAEIHDASPHDEQAFALFGFVGTPPAIRATHRDKVISDAVSQLATLFGPQLASPQAVLMEDWAANPMIATPADHNGPDHHPAYGTPAALRGLWDGNLIFASSEMGNHFGGFLEGALEAAEQAEAALG